MSENSPRMDWAYPSQGDDPWYDGFVDFIQDLDASGFAHREDRSIIWSGGGTLSWTLSSETFEWTGVINIYSPIGGRLIRVPAGTIIDWADGEVVYVQLTRQPLENLNASFVKGTQVLSDDDATAFAVRIGDNIYIRTGIRLEDGGTSDGVAPVASEPLEVEDEGVAVDANTTKINFTGPGATAVQTGPGEVEVNVISGGSGIPPTSGSGNPNGATSGQFGQDYYDTTNEIWYKCVSSPTGTVWVVSG